MDMAEAAQWCLPQICKMDAFADIHPIDPPVSQGFLGSPEINGGARPKKSRKKFWAPLKAYKGWVRSHPGIVSNLDWLLYLTVWNPARTTSAHNSELTYEVYHACVGLLSVWHQHIIDEEQSPIIKPTAALMLDAVEQVETLFELRAIHMEQHGRTSRYGPLAALESVKALLKMAMWLQYPGHLFLRHPEPEDLDMFEAEQGLTDLLTALERLWQRYRVPGQAGAPGQGLLTRCKAWFSKTTPAAPDQLPLPEQQAPSATDSPSGQQHVTPDMQMGMDLVWLGELLHIWRPAIYCALLKRYGSSSWKAWGWSLAVDLLSMHFTHRGKALLRGTASSPPASSAMMQQQQQYGGWGGAWMQPGQPASLLGLAIMRGLRDQPWSQGEQRELADRRKKLLLYLLRSPALDLLLRPVVDSVRYRTSKVPVIGMLTDYMAGLLDTVTAYYCYTSGSR